MDPKKLRVVFVVDAVRGRNGVGTYYQDLVHHLDQHIDKALLISPCMIEPQPYQGLSLPLPGDSTQRAYLPKCEVMAEMIEKMRPHAMVIAVPGPYGLYGYLQARRLNIPMCVAYQTNYEKLVELYWSPGVARMSRGLVQRFHRVIFNAGSMVATISDHMAEEAHQAGAKEVRLVGTPIARDFLGTPAPPAPKDVDSALYVGRLAAEKNLEGYVEAAAAHPRIRFYIAGNGPLRSYVEEQARRLPNVIYLGWLARPQVAAMIDAVDMLILPSFVEAFGTVAVEAMARRRMVLTSPACGINQWPGLAAGLFTMHEGETLAAALARINALPAQSRQARAAQGYAAAQRLNENAVTEWTALLSELAERRTARAKPSPMRRFLTWAMHPSSSNAG